ncbi:hypothetical protein [Dickeya sp. ws52]|uniref:hypothetical protein n=1 Tax=Dickeya sp. ws52 TaxID=2576377 RepID=UPI001180628E|nr:hypothetical protein [Dickeya sp. ws52]TYL42137.1 hypothetical protein FDP13_13750 [Dickeya sp. ws52]
MAYKKAQFISYQLNTFTDYYNSSKDYGYLGNDKSETDINYRINIMKDCIAKSQASLTLDNTDETLKIFMAPEFYFRGNQGAYPVEKISIIMSKMREMTKDKKFKDWLFVFGTAIGYLKHDDGSYEIFNVALVQKGGYADATKDNSVIVYKEYISHIDFLRLSNAHINWKKPLNRIGVVGENNNTQKLTPVSGSRDVNSQQINPVGAGKELSKSGLGGQGIFTIDNVTFGLEICLDHLNGRLHDSPPAAGQYIPQIHLITSAGASIIEENVITTKGGLVFNVDGYATTDINRNIGDYKKPSLQHDCSPKPYRILDAINIDLTTIAKSWKDYFTEQGNILIFEPLVIPPSEKA